MVSSKATLAPAPSILASLIVTLFIRDRKGLKVTATANPPNITYKGHSSCPNGLSSGLSRILELPEFLALGLATPNICYMGHYVPKLAVMGRRHHFPGFLLDN